MVILLELESWPELQSWWIIQKRYALAVAKHFGKKEKITKPPKLPVNCSKIYQILFLNITTLLFVHNLWESWNKIDFLQKNLNFNKSKYAQMTSELLLYANCVQGMCASVRSVSHLFGKMYFPRGHLFLCLCVCPLFVLLWTALPSS